MIGKDAVFYAGVKNISVKFKKYCVQKYKKSRQIWLCEKIYCVKHFSVKICSVKNIIVKNISVKNISVKNISVKSISVKIFSVKSISVTKYPFKDKQTNFGQLKSVPK